MAFLTVLLTKPAMAAPAICAEYQKNCFSSSAQMVHFNRDIAFKEYLKCMVLEAESSCYTLLKNFVEIWNKNVDLCNLCLGAESPYRSCAPGVKPKVCPTKMPLPENIA